MWTARSAAFSKRWSPSTTKPDPEALAKRLFEWELGGDFDAVNTYAYELILKVRNLMRRLGRQDEFDEYVELIRLEYKRKRNFMKLLDGME